MQHFPNNIETDATPGNFSDLVSSAEPGSENKINNLLLRHSLGLRCRNHAYLDGFDLDFLRVNSGTVVADLHDQLIGLVIGIEHQFAGRRLACSRALSCALNTMTDRVSDNMRERLGNRIKQDFVEISILPAEFQGYFLTAALRRVAHYAWKPAK